jgi:hypothetical protein
MTEEERRQLLHTLSRRMKHDEPPALPPMRDGIVLVFAGNERQFHTWVETIGCELNYRPTQCHYIDRPDKIYGLRPDNEHIIDIAVTGSFYNHALNDHPYVQQFLRGARERFRHAA